MLECGTLFNQYSSDQSEGAADVSEVDGDRGGAEAEDPTGASPEELAGGGGACAEAADASADAAAEDVDGSASAGGGAGGAEAEDPTVDKQVLRCRTRN